MTARLTLGSLLFSLFLGWLDTPPAMSAAVTTETKLVPNPGARELMFATDVAINADTAAVGALLPPFNANGGVYIFSLVGTNWVQTQLLTSGKPFDSFGAAVDLSNDTLFVGDPTEPPGVTNLTGDVFIYTNAAGTWSLQQTLVESGGAGDGFGSAVAASGQTLAVGNPRESSVAVDSGAVYIFTEIGTNWLFQAKLKASDPVASAFLGASLAIDGDTVVAGTPNVTPGAAYVFVRNGTNWTEQQKLTTPPLQPAEGFGLDVAVEGNVAAILGQQILNGTNSPAVYVFTRSGTTWALQQTLSPPAGEPNFIFGNTVAIRNGEIVVGIPGRTVDGFSTAGSLAIFDFNGTSWVLVQEVTASDAKSGANLGASLDIGAAGIIAGAPGDVDVGRSGQGAAYVFSTGATNPPVTLNASASPQVLFPPNHKLVPVTITVSNHDSFSSCHIVSVTSNEPVAGRSKGKGKNKNSEDWIITGDLTLLLRAERTGQATSGRIYTITIECTDTSGGTAQTSVTVTVPHDRR